MHIVALLAREVRDLTGDGLSFRMCTKASITRFSSLALALDFTVYTKLIVQRS
jgi:hypothetical protein